MAKTICMLYNEYKRRDLTGTPQTVNSQMVNANMDVIESVDHVGSVVCSFP